MTLQVVFSLRSTLTYHLKAESVSSVIETITVFKGSISTWKGSWNLPPKAVSEAEPDQCFRDIQKTNYLGTNLVSREIIANVEGFLGVGLKD